MTVGQFSASGRTFRQSSFGHGNDKMSLASELDIPESGAIFTFGKSHFADNEPSHFFIKNDPVVAIACGDDHTAVICQQGRVFGFGSNNSGQLGLGHTNTVERPACLKWLKPRKAKQVACGRSHTIIITDNNELYATGDNSEGQLGIGSTDNQLVPQFVEISGNEKVPIKQIAAGAEHTLVLSDEGHAYASGSNSEGQLGLGESVKSTTTFTRIPIEKKVKSVTCGYYHTVLVTDDGEAYVFGNNENQRLSVSSSLQHIFTPTLISLNTTVSGAYCGHHHTFFVGDNGVIYASGSNEYGQLGLPRSVIEVDHPTEINFNKLFDNHSVTKLSCGATHTAFITDNGNIYTCGDSRHHKLCQDENSDDFSNNNSVNGTTSNQYLPKRVDILEGFFVNNVACGGCHTIISATKIQGNNNNMDTKLQTSTVTELPPLQKVPASIMNKNNANTEEVDSTLTADNLSKEKELVDVTEKIEANVELDNVNNNVNQDKDGDKTSLDSLEPNVSGSHILEINNLNTNTENKDESMANSENLDISVKEQKIKTQETIILTKQDTVVSIIETTIETSKSKEAGKTEDNADKMDADSLDNESQNKSNMLRVPETVQYSPVLSVKSEMSQKSMKSSNGSQDSENETIICHSEKSSPQIIKTTKTQAVIPILRADEIVQTAETKIIEECEVIDSKLQKPDSERRISKFFNGLRKDSCIGKSRVISSVDIKEQIKNESVEAIPITDHTNSRACVII